MQAAHSTAPCLLLCAAQDGDNDRVMSMLLFTVRQMGHEANKHGCGTFSQRVVGVKMRASTRYMI